MDAHSSSFLSTTFPIFLSIESQRPYYAALPPRSLPAFQHVFQHFQHCPGALLAVVSSLPISIATTSHDSRRITIYHQYKRPHQQHSTPHIEKRIIQLTSWTAKRVVCMDELCKKVYPGGWKRASPQWTSVPCYIATSWPVTQDCCWSQYCVTSILYTCS
jgi:hypothetical protein